jgi:hypothetical protein
MAASAPGDRKRTIALLVVAACLGALLVYDYSERGRPAEMPSAETGDEAPVAADLWRRVLASREAIDRAYAEAAVPYAEMAAGLWTFSLGSGDPRQALEAAIRDRVARGTRVLELLIGEPETLDAGVFELEARLKLAAGSTRSAFEALWDLGEPAYGIRWTNFTVQIAPSNSHIEIIGELSAVVVQAVE